MGTRSPIPYPSGSTLLTAPFTPILRKLKSDGLLTTYLQEESGGPPRKYYSITKLGREIYERDRAEYLQFAQAIRTLLEDQPDDKA